MTHRALRTGYIGQPTVVSLQAAKQNVTLAGCLHAPCNQAASREIIIHSPVLLLGFLFSSLRACGSFRRAAQLACWRWFRLTRYRDMGCAYLSNSYNSQKLQTQRITARQMLLFRYQIIIIHAKSHIIHSLNAPSVLFPYSAITTAALPSAGCLRTLVRLLLCNKIPKSFPFLSSCLIADFRNKFSFYHSCKAIQISRL